MKFRTELAIEPSPIRIDHDSAILTIGSCFSDEIGSRLRSRLFNVMPNPFGTLFNPASIKRLIKDVAEGKTYNSTDIFLGNEGAFHSYLHHSKFSSDDESTILTSINSIHEQVRKFLSHENLIVVLTLGSARAFRHIESGHIVANCHKQPSKEFETIDLSINDIVDELRTTTEMIQGINGNARFLLTVSPVRHVAYGLHADRLSKSKLLVAADIVASDMADKVGYFPAYELIVDDLRDYRFYSDDLVHPSSMGADYVYEHFESTFMDKSEIEYCRLCLKLHKLLNHRPIIETESSRENRRRQIDELKSRLAAVYPSILETL